MKRKYPVGIQSFEKIRKEDYLYIDKTPFIYKMITEGCPYFLSRPRRFGKSLLISTLQAVFEGRRELFEEITLKNGTVQPQLFIATTDWEWEKYPVLRFDFSAGDLAEIAQLDTLIDATLSNYERQYGIVPEVKDANIRMVNLLRTLHQQTGKRVVVLVDEYDNFILHALGNDEKVTLARQRFQNLFSPLKAEDDHLQFAFVTGISKFSQMGIFSKLNNLMNISMRDDYAAVCGISQKELTTQLRPDIEMLAQRNGTTYDEMFAMMKARYDGYHFSRQLQDIYNPFSLVNAFNSGDLSDYWFDRGTSGALISMLAQMPPVDMAQTEGLRLPSTAFDLPLVNFDDPIPVLYQSGYLTIKDCQPIGKMTMYTLGFPNDEVRMGFAECLYQHVAANRNANNSKSVFLNAYNDFLISGDLPPFIEAIQSFFAGIPYQWAQDNHNEHYYHSLLYTLLTSFGADIRAEEPTAKGRSDLTLLMSKAIYVIEIKYDHTAQEALDQIDQKGYADKYLADGRPVFKVGLAFSSEERNITEWRSQPFREK
ncbi:MAG: ATP-binding protein [Prevotella sp.]|nr:ATP-binding protein [Prevotella sp.]